MTFQGQEISAALTEAVHAWLLRDPFGSSDWIATHRAALSAAESALAVD